MCRISGIISRLEAQQDIVTNVRSMCASMAHGGPDGSGIESFDVEGLAFGHRRLALLDLSEAGHQPMTDSTNRLLLTYNGEIYNYRELKLELTHYAFKTGTDTEVILAGFVTWGTSVFAKLKGMFAFGLFDRETGITYLVRDPGGIKPLYYSHVNGTTVFASEVRAFKATTYDFEEDPDWKVYFLAFGHIPEPFTTLHSVRSLPKGHFLTIQFESGAVELKLLQSDIVDLPTVKDRVTANTIINATLTEAVRKHLLADAKIGVFLSGGIDSSILTMLANQECGNKLHSLSINFNEEEYSEKRYQDLITSRLDNAHDTYTVTEEELAVNFKVILNAIDQPSSDCINSWFVSKYASEQGLKAVLSGIGADEIFGGYPSFKKVRFINWVQYLPKWLLRLTKLAPSLRIRRLYYLSYNSTIGQYLFLRGFFSPDVIARVLGITENRVNSLLQNIPVKADISEMSPGERASWIETNLYMQNQLLKDTDVMGMSHGLEIRVPFLDQTFLTALQQISPELRFNQHRQKNLLIEGFKNIIPRQIWDRPKMGFTFPFAEWLIKNEEISNSDRYDNPHAKALIANFKAGKLHWSKAFALYQVFNGH